MNSPLIAQLASQRITEIREEVAGYRVAAAAREPRESIKERAGWALIHAGLKLTGPPARPRPAGPRPAGL
jgi:hypothetical protein